MNFRLKERKEARLSELKITDTFKIPESSFIFMLLDVDGLTVRPKVPIEVEQSEQVEKPAPIRVLIPEGKIPIVCLSSGKTQFMNLKDKVQIVDFDVDEVISEKRKEHE